MVDWAVARSIARKIAGDPGRPQVTGDLDELCADSERRVVAYTQLRPMSALPPPELIDRSAWLDANLATMRSTLDPVVDRMIAPSPRVPSAMNEALKAAGGLVISAEV